MTRKQLISNLALPIALVGLAACPESDAGENHWGPWNDDGSETHGGGSSDAGDDDGEQDDEGKPGDDGAPGDDGDEDEQDDDQGDEDNGDGDGDADGGDGDNGDGDGDGDGEMPPLSGTPTEENLRVAFLGDQGLNNDSSAVLDLVVSEGADFVVIAGDFDYENNPDGWDNMLNDSLGADFPVFAVAGNHDEAEFDGPDGYQTKIIAHLQNAIDDGATCTGEPGLNSACSYKGLFLAMSGVDVLNGKDESADYLRNQLAENDAIWSVCVWHKNMTDMQAGDKPDEAGWGVYQACQDEAGIVITGHEHSYARTLTLTDLGNEPNGHGAVGEPQHMVVGEGSTYVSVVGLGGRSIRDYDADLHDDDTWWASISTANYYLKNGEVVDGYDAKAGLLFIDFNVDGNPNKAHAYFKDIDGVVVDEYDIVR